MSDGISIRSVKAERLRKGDAVENPIGEPRYLTVLDVAFDNDTDQVRVHFEGGALAKYPSATLIRIIDR